MHRTTSPNQAIATVGIAVLPFLDAVLLEQSGYFLSLIDYSRSPTFSGCGTPSISGGSSLIIDNSVAVLPFLDAVLPAEHDFGCPLLFTGRSPTFYGCGTPS